MSIFILVDCSASIEQNITETLHDIFEKHGPDTVCSVYFFNHRLDCIVYKKLIRHVPNRLFDEFVTGGSTALYDAVAHVFLESTSIWDIFYILTDGVDTSSKEYTVDDMYRLTWLRRIRFINPVKYDSFSVYKWWWPSFRLLQ